MTEFKKEGGSSYDSGKGHLWKYSLTTLQES
jgi:hypothetical protein